MGDSRSVADVFPQKGTGRCENYLAPLATTLITLSEDRFIPSKLDLAAFGFLVDHVACVDQPYWSNMKSGECD